MDDDDKFRALLARDAAADGRFFFGVMTTGVYCKPSCGARTPLRRNVRFYSTAAAARAAGLRPCKRCRPDDGVDLVAARVAHVRALIDAAEVPPTLVALAAQVGISPAHLQRQFTRVVGVSPARYAAALRQVRFRGALRGGSCVTDAIYEAGYSGPSRAYGDRRLGMSPQAFARGGDTEAISYAIVASALGRVLVAATARGVCAVRLGHDDAGLEAELIREFPRARLTREDDRLVSVTSCLVTYLAGRGPWPRVPIDVRGTAFQIRVWEALRGIASGETRSYRALAEALGDARAARAVGNACAANPIALLVPCHRIVRGDGETGAYRWGSERKRALLALERGDR